jgi:hypothetical protein
MQQIARNLTDADGGFLSGAHHLLHDRDPLFTRAFRELLKSSGAETVKLPVRSPDLDAPRSNSFARSNPSVWPRSSRWASATFEKP